MRYLKALIVLIAITGIMLFGIHNPTAFNLEFLSYRLKMPLPLWGLIMIAFFAGIVPIFIVGLPERIQDFKSLNALLTKRKELQKALKNH